MGASTLNKKDLFRLHVREVEEDYATLMRSCDYYESYIESLQDENAKLRELCSDMHVWMGRALYEGSTRRHEYELMTERMDDLGVPHD